MLLDFARVKGFAVPGQEDGLPDLAKISLGHALLLVARLGGYLNRKNDAPPGHQVVWEGYTRMVVGATTMERIVETGSLSALHACNI